MSETRNITVAYTPAESGAGESFWIRLEQERPEDETITVAEAAAVIDGIYGIEPCDDGMGGGGEAADEENGPTEEELDAAMAEAMRAAGFCDLVDHWTAVVRVYRSHPAPGYELRSETATAQGVEPVSESCRQDVEASGSVIELDMPYAGGLTGIPAGVGWSVRGSTVNLDRPVNGRLVLRYNTHYERVTLRVPTRDAAPDADLFRHALVVSGGPGRGNGTRTRELPSAAVVAFWRDLAASCELTPPETDEELSDAEREEICGGSEGGGGGSVSGTGCWKTIAHYSRCNCSRAKFNEWEEEAAADCGSHAGGTNIGREEVFDGYGSCEGEEDEVNDPEYYEKHCCQSPPGPLPRCRKTYDAYGGGHEIEGGPEHWRNIYGPDVGMVSVLPKNGKCGELVTEWNVPTKNCCDDAEPLTPHPDNPTTIHAPGSATLRVLGGAPDTGKRPHPRRWRASAGYTFANGSGYEPDGGNMQGVNAAADACNNAVIVVDDGCSSVTMRLTRDNPADAMELLPGEATVAPGATLGVEAHNAQGEVYWSAGTLKLLTPQGLPAAVFEAPDGFCGTDEITATDACLNMAAMTVLSTKGRWVKQTEFDPCSPPWGGVPRLDEAGSSQGTVTVGGWRATMLMESSGVQTFPAGGGGCQAAWDKKQHYGPCGYTGEELYRRNDGESAFHYQPPTNWCEIRTCDNPMCRHEEPDPQPWRYYEWVSAAQWINELWKWECEEA